MKNTLEKPHTEALFRFQVLSLILAQEQMGQLRSQAVRDVAAMTHGTRKISRRTLYRWLAAFDANGFPGLNPTQRQCTASSTVIPEPVIEFFKKEKSSDPQASVPELIRRARHNGLIESRRSIDRSTVWRALKRMGVDTGRAKAPQDRDCRRFSFAHRMDMVLCDGKHFRAGHARLRRVALFFLDDATRAVLGVKVGTSESAALFLNGLYLTLRKHGSMSALFVDNGSGFIAHDAINVLRNLNILFIHGTAGYPQGRGKIERFNRTVSDQILRLMDGNPQIDPDCTALEHRLRHYLDKQYNCTPHESLNGQAPMLRFSSDSRPLSLFNDPEKLLNSFVLQKDRSVSHDHVISFNGVHYEVPRGLAGTKIFLLHNPLDDSLTIHHRGRSVRLIPLNAQANARDKRAKNAPSGDQKPRNITKTGAQMAFDNDHQPIVDADGGFSIPTEAFHRKQDDDES